MTNILVVAAHPDDEILGCGGAMASHTARGDKVHVIIMAQGLTSRGVASEQELARLRSCARRANKHLGVYSVDFFDFPDNRMDTVALLDVILAIETVIASVQPTRIYTHHPSDLNVDHRRVAEAVSTACRPLPGNASPDIFYFEVLSSTGWSFSQPSLESSPNVYRDISRYLDAKIEALQEYADEIRDWPHARSCEAVVHLARFRGAVAGLNAAEAFQLSRLIERD